MFQSNIDKCAKSPKVTHLGSRDMSRTSADPDIDGYRIRFEYKKQDSTNVYLSDNSPSIHKFYRKMKNLPNENGK